ncbi:hypothetical protein KJ761_01795 [Patescibacteria group bacterium]|nr:hypothetical protein [Patescibacteria group bacterium]
MNSQINYISIIKEAWQITWKNKYLWWFGLLVALSGGVGSNFSSGGWEEKGGWEENVKQKASDWMALYWEWIVLGFILLILLMIVFIILNIWGRGALVASLGKVIAKEATNFKAGMKEGKKFFWPILGLNLFLFGISLATLIIIGTPIVILFLAKAYWVGGFLALVGLLIFILLVILFSFLQKYGILYLVLGKVSFWAALENAYRLLRRNLLSSVIMGIIFIPLSLLAGLAAIVFILGILLIFLIPGVLAYFLIGKWAIITLAILGILILLAGILAINSIYAVFAQAVWILFFRHIALPKEEEKVAEVVAEIKSAEITEVVA